MNVDDGHNLPELFYGGDEEERRRENMGRDKKLCP